VGRLSRDIQAGRGISAGGPLGRWENVQEVVTVELESYFDFISSDAIRIRGTRVGIEHVLRFYLEGAGPEEIVLHFPSLTLEQVHASILYYLHNRREVEAYFKRWWEAGEAAWQEQQRNPDPFIRELRERLERKRAELEAEGTLFLSSRS
jgi:uncharacterized protein (DUF433 family)